MSQKKYILKDLPIQEIITNTYIHGHSQKFYFFNGYLMGEEKFYIIQIPLMLKLT